MYIKKQLKFYILLLCFSLWGVLGSSVKAHAEKVSISFRDIDVASVLESVAEITGNTFIVDPRVKGRMTIISNEPIEAHLLFDVFLSALQVHGFQAVKDGPIYRILPLSQAYRVSSEGGGGDMTTEIIRLRYTLANNVVSSIRPLLTQGALMQVHVASNSVIINDTQSQITRVKKIMRELDKPDTDVFEVWSLKNNTVEEVLRIVKELGLDKDERISVVADEVGNRLMAKGPPELRKLINKLVNELDVIASNNSNIDVIYLHYLDVTKTKSMIDQMLSGGAFNHITGVKSVGSDKKYSIQEDVANNALVVAGSPELMTSLKLLINRLDRPRVQVLIEAVIAEVTQSQARNLGAQLTFLSKNGGAGVVDFNGAMTAIAGSVLTLRNSPNNATAVTAIGARATSQGLSYAGALTNSAGDQGIGLLIQTLQTNAQANILSTPSILTLDNEEASITVGQEVPFLTGSFTNTGNGSVNPFQTIERKEVGISLKVTPQVNEGDAVRLKLTQESSDVLPSSGGSAALQQSTSKRTLSTNVMVYDGQLLILGGQMTQNENTTINKVPLLGDIPLLGKLFRSEIKNQTDNVLMIFIRPTIIRSKGEAGEVSLRKYNLLAQKQIKKSNNLKTKGLVSKTLQGLKDDALKQRNESSATPTNMIK